METTMTKTDAISSTPTKQLAKQLAAVREHLTDCFPEREATIDNILTAAVAGEHCLMVGIPGTGKSLLAREFASCIGGSFYEYLFTKFTTPEEFLGPFSIKGLKEDRYDRVLSKRLAECEVAFLDEIFKSNSASLNQLLPILNERIVFQGGGAQAIPLRIAVAASNELPTDPTLRALWDRIVLRSFVEPLQGDKARRSVMLGQTFKAGARPQLDSRLLDALDLGEIEVPDYVVDVIMDLRRQLETNGIVYGDRRWVKAAKVVRAFALVCGDTEADTSHLTILSSVLWDKQDQIADVAAMVSRVAAPQVNKAREIFDALMADLQVTDSDPLEKRPVEDLAKVLPKMKTAHKRIKKLAAETSSPREEQEIRAIASKVARDFNALREVIKERYAIDDEEV